ncbi:hypothetical protein BGZ59_008323 [Podila verticillata]|nr:hypothetical protein BGZ59_008323 [Podila verticillata]
MSKEPDNTVNQHFETAVKVDAQIPNDTINPAVTEQIIDLLPDFREPSDPAMTMDRLFPNSHARLSTLLKDTSSMNIAFTFGVNGAARSIGLWAHRSVLAQELKFAELISKLKVIIDLDVDLEDFAIGYPPSKSHLPSCRERPVIEDLLPSTESSAAKRGTSWRDLFELADCYQAMRLREHCRVKIVSSQDKSNAADILFDFAYRHHDLKEQVLNFLSNPEDGLSAGDRDPFTAYKDHPKGYLLVVEILKRIKIHAH